MGPPLPKGAGPLLLEATTRADDPMDTHTAFFVALSAISLGLPLAAAFARRPQDPAGHDTPQNAGLARRLAAAQTLRDRMDASSVWRDARLDGRDTPADLFFDALSDALFVDRGWTPVPHCTTTAPPPEAMRNGALFWSWGIDQLDPDTPPRIHVDLWDSVGFRAHLVQRHGTPSAKTADPAAARAPDRRPVPAWLAHTLERLAVHQNVPVSVRAANRRRYALPTPASRHARLAAHAALQDLLPPGTTVAEALDDIASLCRYPS